ncbi:MAG: MFS transporter, partial [Chloroflexi bacterium]|nr:MFS transporter [Chloroflexota bacterium]
MQQDPSTEPAPPGASGKRRWFYGWTIVSVVSVVSFAGGVETNPVLGVFQDPITSEFGWSRAAFTLPVSIGTFAGGIAAVGLGPIMDRYGSRWVMAIAVIAMGAIFIGIGAMQNYWQHFALQMLGRTVVASTFFLIVGVVIPKWFVVKRGRAIGVAAFGQRIGHATFPIMIERIMAYSNWRVAAITLGVTVWVTALLPTLLFMRRRPEDMGLRPDGVMPDLRRASDGTVTASYAAPREEISFNRRQALRTPAF